MYQNEIVGKIEDFREIGIPRLIKRAGKLIQARLTVSTVIGARRAGKSFRVLQVAEELISSKSIASIRHVCHLDFDNPVLKEMTAQDLGKIPEIFLSITPEATITTPLLFIFDEIHIIPGWELFAVELSRNPNWYVVVTGSSSKSLRYDIATELRGKALPTEIYPLSFKEFLAFKKTPETFSTKGSALIRADFNEFLKWGSYPVMPHTEEFLRVAILREYFDIMILKDIIQRYDISKPRLCIHLFNYLLSCMGKPFTGVSSLAFLKLNDEKVSRDAVTEWINCAQDSWLFFAVSVFSDSLKAQNRNYKKLYAIDWALAHVNSRSWDGSLSRSLENMVYIHLRRHFHRVFYYLTRDKRQEVDFIAVDFKGSPHTVVQVCLDVGDPVTFARELSPLVVTARYFKTVNNLIITIDQEKNLISEGVEVRIVPAWKWLLEEPGI
jgi:predicted AAA+ superfamily ATPase